MQSMDDCYDKLRRSQVNLHNEDISLKFSELGISFDDVAQVRLNQTTLHIRCFQRKPLKVK